MKLFTALLLSVLLLTGCGIASPEALQANNGNVTQSVYPAEQLRSIAYTHAGVAEADVYDVDEDWDRGPGDTVYELDFEAQGVEYEYRIDAGSGKILHSSRKPDEASQAVAQMITQEEAKQIALEHAGLNQGAVNNLRVEYDREENHYDVEFVVKRMEYEYEIDATTGQILKAEKDNAFD